ncbi:hypothetical protein [Francisella tularensis]|uniref:hypothetical protein n=1 Tax=Francisella tularensis TaxID=263 RepID=UPI000197A877|nr:hypothetical protein [Francisella tularensis]
MPLLLALAYLYNSSIQEDNATDEEKENNSDDNNLKEYGPVTICANNAVYDDNRLKLLDNLVIYIIYSIYHKLLLILIK